MIPKQSRVTEQGFQIYAEFEDTRGRTVRVQESSADGEPCVYLFVRAAEGHNVVHWRSGGGWEPAPRPRIDDHSREGWQAIPPHLNIDQCRVLIAALQEHIDRFESSKENT